MPANIVRDMPMAEYQAVKALSAGGAHALVAECPAVYFHGSPFNPAYEPKNVLEFDIGTAAHLALLEPAELERRVLLVEADNWRAKAATGRREEAYGAGLIPLLPKNLETVQRMAKAVRANEWAAGLLDGAQFEVSYFWTADGAPCKARADIVTYDGEALADIKTAASANPRAIQRAAFDQGHFIRAPWYLDGFEVATGRRPRGYWFIVVGKEEPHPVTVCRLDERAMEWGRMAGRRARRMFARCQRERDWPGYCRAPVTLELPVWAEYQLADDEASGLLTSDDVRRSMEFLAP